MERRVFFKNRFASLGGIMFGVTNVEANTSVAMVAINSYLLSGSSDGSHPGNSNPAFGELTIPPLLDTKKVQSVKQFSLSMKEGGKTFFKVFQQKPMA